MCIRDSLYDALGIRLSGKTAVKISTGEPGGHNFLQPALIGPLTERLHGTIVECNTAYEGQRNPTQEHWKAIQEHGFLDIAPCDIMDETGELALPVTNGMHLQANFVDVYKRQLSSSQIMFHAWYSSLPPLETYPVISFVGIPWLRSIAAASAA